MPTRSHTLSVSLSSSSSSSSDALSSSFSVVNGIRNNNNVFLFYCVCISRCLFHCHCCNIIVITVSLSPSFASPPFAHALSLVQTSFCMFYFVGSVLNQTPRILFAVFRGSLVGFQIKQIIVVALFSVSFHDLPRLKGVAFFVSIKILNSVVIV